jgi:CTP:molybdopterin cytidylyltransferase MocA
MFSRTVFGELIQAAGVGARQVVRADRTRVLEVPVNDPGILDDVDTHDAYLSLLQRLRA